MLSSDQYLDIYQPLVNNTLKISVLPVVWRQNNITITSVISVSLISCPVCCTLLINSLIVQLYGFSCQSIKWLARSNEMCYKIVRGQKKPALGQGSPTFCACGHLGNSDTGCWAQPQNGCRRRGVYNRRTTAGGTQKHTHRKLKCRRQEE